MPAPKSFYALEEETKYPGVNKYTVKDPSLDIWPGPGGELPPYPSHPIALPGDPWWGTFPPIDPVDPPIIVAPVQAFVMPIESEEPIPPTVNLGEGSTRVMMYFGPGTVAFEWYLPPLATTKPEPKK